MIKREGRFNNAGQRLENGVKEGLVLSAMLVAQRARAKARRDTGRLKRSITRNAPYASGPDRWAIDVGTNLVYAAVHEFGFTGIITDRQRAFFRYKARETGDGMWRALSLSHSYTITPQPYLRPAFEESKEEIRRILLTRALHALLRR